MGELGNMASSSDKQNDSSWSGSTFAIDINKFVFTIHIYINFYFKPKIAHYKIRKSFFFFFFVALYSWES